MEKINFVLVFMFLLFIPMIAAKPSQDDLSCFNYQLVINNLSLDILAFEQQLVGLNESVIILTNQSDYYQNLSNYYKDLYNSKEINITNRELILLNQNISILNNNVTTLNTEIHNLKRKITLFSFEVGFSILSLSAIGIVIIEFLFKFIRKKREKKDEENE